jgi:hypothetical protein
MMDEYQIQELLSYLQEVQDLKGLREGLYLVVWEYLQWNLDTGLDSRINGKFLVDFNSLIEVLCILEANIPHTTKLG